MKIALGKAPTPSSLARLGETATIPVTVDVRTPKEIADQKLYWQVYGVLGTISMAASAYHGYKRNGGSLGWALWWALMGGTFPVITPVIAVAQGFGEPTFKTTRVRDE